MGKEVVEDSYKQCLDYIEKPIDKLAQEQFEWMSDWKQVVKEEKDKYK